MIRAILKKASTGDGEEGMAIEAKARQNFIENNNCGVGELRNDRRVTCEAVRRRIQGGWSQGSKVRGVGDGVEAGVKAEGYFEIYHIDLDDVIVALIADDGSPAKTATAVAPAAWQRHGAGADTTLRFTRHTLMPNPSPALMMSNSNDDGNPTITATAAPAPTARKGDGGGTSNSGCSGDHATVGAAAAPMRRRHRQQRNRDGSTSDGTTVTPGPSAMRRRQRRRISINTSSSAVAVRQTAPAWRRRDGHQ
ncbi:hypothetical protein BC827DRAFT_1385867 [Russula dissimulans]|nr:hypothetical protein BC827DRAFT_1385867 [Russula dissimulans]